MSSSAPTALEALVDHAKTLDCIHCGLCLRDCPTYRLTGVESSSPRGRVHLMRAIVEDGLVPDASLREELDSCLLCRNCESVCPSGVQFGALMGHTRAELAATMPTGPLKRLARYVGFRLVLPSRTMLRCVAFSMRLVERTGLQQLAIRLLGKRGSALRSMPSVPPWSERRLLPTTTLAEGEKLSSVAVLQGCVMPEFLGRVNRATVRVLSAAGLESRTANHVCCGSLHAHNGDREGARRLAKQTIEAFDSLRDAAGKPLDVVVNSAGCGSHMKEYAELFEHDPDWHERAEAFGERVVDFSELLARKEFESRLSAAVGPVRGVTSPLAFDDPCHLCHGQGIRSQPRALIDLVPDMKRVEIEESESCCGSAGIYSLLRPDASRAILSPRLDAVVKSGARTLVTANPGCQLQWQSGLAEREPKISVLHIAELLALALGDPNSAG